MKIVIVSGYFNPVHKGHIEYFNKSKEHGDKLYVIVNNDKQRELKGSKEFQSEDERMFIVQNLKLFVKHSKLSILWGIGRTNTYSPMVETKLTITSLRDTHVIGWE
jgi:cytidyltransferase-like protein